MLIGAAGHADFGRPGHPQDRRHQGLSFWLRSAAVCPYDSWVDAMNTLILADAISWNALLPLAVFGAVAAGAWWLLDMMAASRPRAEERLDEFKNPQNRRDGKRRDQEVDAV